METERTASVVLNHTWHKCDEADCLVCNGGLKWCTVCGGAEITLPRHCPDRALTEEERALIECGELQYFNGKWWRPNTTVLHHASVATIQWRVGHWLLECVGKEVAEDLDERNHRFAEEAFELLQACGYTLDQLEAMARHVYVKEPGKVEVEAADVLICLVPLASAHGFDLGRVTMNRIDINWENIDKIREKNRTKPIRSGKIKPGVR